MKNTLLPKSYVLINKIAYGTKVPLIIQDFPLVGNMFQEKKQLEKDFKALKPFKNFEREDIVVFKAVTKNNNFLIKRIIGMPGDTLEIIDSQVYVNHFPLDEKMNYCYNYKFGENKSVMPIKTYSNKEWIELDESIKKTFKKNILSNSQGNFDLFPVNKRNEWSLDKYGPLIVPKKGGSILINQYNFQTYEYIMKFYEKENLGNVVNDPKYYTFKKNYFFMMGDNRHNSIDSRNFGFVPEDHIQGKMVFTF